MGMDATMIRRRTAAGGIRRKKGQTKMPIEVKAWKCRWCNKVSRTKSGIMLHEDRCRSNPDFNCCENCVHAYNAAVEYTDGIILFCDPYCNYHGRSIFLVRINHKLRILLSAIQMIVAAGIAKRLSLIPVGGLRVRGRLVLLTSRNGWKSTKPSPNS